MKDLPRFRARDPELVKPFVAHILTNKDDPRSAFVRLIEHPDHSFRAVFAARFFVLNPGETTPSKSQWNNLKKKLKRAAPDVFIFKDHGSIDCAPGTPGCYYLDFAYFLVRTDPKDAPPMRSATRPPARAYKPPNRDVGRRRRNTP